MKLNLFDKMFEEKQKLLLEKMYMPVLLNGLSDSSLEFSYTSDLLNLIRAFHPIIGNDSFLKIIFENVQIVYPHGKHWYYHLLIDCIKNINHQKSNNILTEVFDQLTIDQKVMILNCLTNIQKEKGYGINSNKYFLEVIKLLSE